MVKPFTVGTFLLLAATVLADQPTPLHDAVSRDDVESVRLQFQKDANPNRKNPDNLTPLHIAARAGRLEVTKLLLENRARPGG